VLTVDQPALEATALEDGSYVFRDEAVLGTRLRMDLVAANFGVAQTAAFAVRAEIDRLNGIFNSRDPASELFVLNRSRTHIASPELLAVVAAAERWRTTTNSAYSGRLGHVLDLWRHARSETPSRRELECLALAADRANVVLDASTRTITRPDAVSFALDGLAKGWIVDRAYDIARATPGVTGALIDIGGDIRCGGAAPGPQGWCVDIGDPAIPADNAPVVARAHLRDAGIATSGRGPRDREIDGALYSPTLSPRDGWPIDHRRSASVVAKSAADADALATALLVLSTEEGIALAESNQAEARITDANRRTNYTRLAQVSPVTHVAPSHDWNAGWQALATFTAPRRQLIRDPHFRSPYMAMWITDVNNNPVRTLILVGKRADWQKDNFIWWTMNRERTERLVAVRSMSTSRSGTYNVFWDGVDDTGKPVRADKYVLHVETSRERGKHTYRALTLDFDRATRFVENLPPTEEGGGLRVSFDHY
jgi:thiamine biosynthesis lipoprotein